MSKTKYEDEFFSMTYKEAAELFGVCDKTMSAITRRQFIECSATITVDS